MWSSTFCCPENAVPSDSIPAAQQPTTPCYKQHGKAPNREPKQAIDQQAWPAVEHMVDRLDVVENATRDEEQRHSASVTDDANQNRQGTHHTAPHGLGPWGVALHQRVLLRNQRMRYHHRPSRLQPRLLHLTRRMRRQLQRRLHQPISIMKFGNQYNQNEINYTPLNGRSGET